MNSALTYSALAESINTKFQAQLDERQLIELELVEVSEPTITPGQEQFSLVFRGPKEFFLGQGTREMEHQQLGQFQLFIVPIREDALGYYYEAVFNRIN
ncbi:MAG TPA: hypothetical protein VJ023_05210 [Pyrinomonadaceae bacterium]|nr:hypothetical protein [Pyrinomonadaceae bacterium]